MATERLSRRQFLKSISTFLPMMLFLNQNGRENGPPAVLGLHIPFQKLPEETIVEPFKRLLLNCGANTVVVDIKSEFGLTHIPFSHKYQPRFLSDLESPERLADFLNWAALNGIRVIGRLCLMPDQKLLYSYPGFALKKYDGTMWLGAHGPWVNPFRLEAAYYNAAIAVAAVNFGIQEINIDYIRFPSGEDNVDQILHTCHNNFNSRTGALRNYLEIIYSAVKNVGGDLSADYFGGTAWLEITDMGIGQHIETQAPFLDGLYPMAYPGLSATKWQGIPTSCKVGTDCPYEYVYLITKRTRERLDKVNPSVSVRTWFQAYPDYRFGRRMTLREFEAQQFAAFHAGAAGVLAWNTSLVYHQDLYKRIHFLQNIAPII